MDTQVILMVQDQGENLAGFLKQHTYTVIGRSTGAAGLEILSRCHVHLLIVETRLADGSGFDLCRRLRQQGHHQPVLMLTGPADETEKVLALEMGADDCVNEPYSPRELLSRVRALLRRAYGEFAHPSGEQLCVGDLVIDRLRGQVWHAGHLITLTPIEFRLLVHLAQHAAQVLSRAQIIEAVWGFEVDVASERVVNTHICRLRAKIEADNSQMAIQTVSGLGYRLKTKGI